MASKKKCFPGPAFDSLDVLLDWIDSGFWVFIGSRAYHPSFVRNRMLGMVREEQRNGTIRACYDGNEKPYSTDRLILEDKTKNIFSAGVVDRLEQNYGPVKFYAENSDYGIVGWSFDCPCCGYANRFVDESDLARQCLICHKLVKLVPITYSSGERD